MPVFVSKFPYPLKFVSLFPGSLRSLTSLPQRRGFLFPKVTPLTELGSSFIMATLGMGGWLALTQQGLSPCKKRQASLGALTVWLSGRGRASETPWLTRTIATSRRGIERGEAPVRFIDGLARARLVTFDEYQLGIAV